MAKNLKDMYAKKAKLQEQLSKLNADIKEEEKRQTSVLGGGLMDILKAKYPDYDFRDVSVDDIAALIAGEAPKTSTPAEVEEEEEVSEDEAEEKESFRF